MKRPWVRNRPHRKIKLGIFFLPPGLAFNELFLNPDPGESALHVPVIASSSNDFTETILEKSFETLQFIWAKLRDLFGDHAGGAFNTFFETIKGQPLILAGIVLLIAGLSFAIIRHRKIKAERKQMLEDLKKSLAEDDYEEENPPLPTDSETAGENLGDDEATLPHEVIADENALAIESNDAFIADSTLAAEPYEPEHIAETGDEETDGLKEVAGEPVEEESHPEEQPAGDSSHEAIADDKILQKLDEEFTRLENEFQDVDPQEVIEPDLATDSGDPLIAHEEATTAEPEDDEDMDQSLVDLQEEMEQTIQELSEQLAQEDTETSGTPPVEELAETSDLTAEPEPTVADTASAEVTDDATVEEFSSPALPPQEETVAEAPPTDELPPVAPPEPATQQAEETQPDAAIAAPAIEVPQQTAEQKPEPPPAKEPRLDPKKTHRQISHLLSFQKNLENQLHKMQVPPAPKKKAAEIPEDFALQTGEKNYEQSKLTLKKKSSFDLLESFILLDSQKKHD